MARDTEGGQMREVIFADLRDSERPVVVSAEHGTVKVGEAARDLVFDLRDGAIVIRNREDAGQRIVHFEQALYCLDVARLVGNKGKNLAATSTRPRSIELSGYAAARDSKARGRVRTRE